MSVAQYHPSSGRTCLRKSSVTLTDEPPHVVLPFRRFEGRRYWELLVLPYQALKDRQASFRLLLPRRPGLVLANAPGADRMVGAAEPDRQVNTCQPPAVHTFLDTLAERLHSVGNPNVASNILFRSSLG